MSKAPELDEHGCKIGEEVYDVEQGKCVPLQPKAEVGPPMTVHKEARKVRMHPAQR